MKPSKTIQNHHVFLLFVVRHLLFGQLVEELIFDLHVGNEVHLSSGSILGDVLRRELVWLDTHHLNVALVHLNILETKRSSRFSEILAVKKH